MSGALPIFFITERYESVSSAVRHAQGAAIAAINACMCGNVSGNIDISGSDYEDIMRDLHYIAMYCVAGTGCKVDDPLCDLNIKTFQIQDNGAVSEQCISYFSRAVDGCRLDDAYFHAGVRILFLDLAGHRCGFTAVCGAESLPGLGSCCRQILVIEVITHRCGCGCIANRSGFRLCSGLLVVSVIILVFEFLILIVIIIVIKFHGVEQLIHNTHIS